MARVRSGDAEIVYEVVGQGPPLVLLHAFPVHHELWSPAASALSSRYRLILPDLRGHGDSEVGEGPATMAKHATDLARVLDDAGIGRAAFAGVSIGGYVLFEFWRRCRERVAALVLCDTKAQPDTPEIRAGRLKSAADVMESGTELFIDSMIPRLLGHTTRSTRLDLVEDAHRMMLKMAPLDINLVQLGMAERPDSVPTLKTIDVPVLIVNGEEDIVTAMPDAELMRQHIPGSQLKVIPRAGHFAVWERPGDVGPLLRQFLDSVLIA